MLTALISTIVGLISGALPKAIDEIGATRGHKREMEFLRLQHELQMARETANAESKMRDAESSIVAEEIRATREQLSAIIETQGRATGNAIIDGFNAILRPTVAAGVVIFFFWAAAVYTNGVVDQYQAGKISVDAFNTAIWGSLVGEGIMAVFGFLFGYRSTVSTIKR